MKKKQTAFRKWLDAQGLTIEGFCKLAPEMFRYPTVAKWAAGETRPSRRSRQDIKEVRPDCPFVSMGE